MNKIMLVLLSSILSHTALAGDLTIYWSTDGVASAQVDKYARQFETALEQSLGLEADLVIADTGATSQAVQASKVDVLVTCNEVDSSFGAAMGMLSEKTIDKLTCLGGMRRDNWELAMDQDIDRKYSGEIWVYMMRNSRHFKLLSHVRNSMPDIRKQVDMKALVTALK